MADQTQTLLTTPASPEIVEEPETPVFLREQPFLREKLLTYAANLLRDRQLPSEEQGLFSFLSVALTEHRALALVETAIKALKSGRAVRATKLGDLEARLDHARQAAWHFWGNRRTHGEFSQRLIAALEAEAIRQRRSAGSGSGGFASRFGELVRFFGLNQHESDILVLAYLVRVGLIDPFRSTGWGNRTAVADRILAIATATAIPHSLCTQLLANTSTLRRGGCLDDDLDFDKRLDLFLCGVNNEPIASNFFVRHTHPPLPWAMHGKLAEQHGEWLKTLLRQRDRSRGLNILLYGEPGTGKTSFSESLAAELGLELYRIKKGDESRKDADVNSRLTSLLLCNKQVDPARSLIMIDEADGVLRSQVDGVPALLGGGAVGDKGALNTILDQITIPCLWITNTPPEALDPSSRRRFDYSIRFDKLSRDQRCQVWRNIVARYHLEACVDEALIENMADRFAVSAGGVDLALRHCAQLWQQHPPVAGKAQEHLAKILVPHCELLGIPVEEGHGTVAVDYALDGLNVKGKLPLQQIVAAAGRFRHAQESRATLSPDAPHMSLLLHGPSGTGKTEFAKYLGQALDCPVLTRMGGDLLDKYVGGTEAKIRQAFRQAHSERAILFLDEVDGLLRSRELADKSWEVTQVNELLHAMEQATCLLVCATNAFDALDPATLRRFTFKLEFGYLDQRGKHLFYQRMFMPLCPDPLTAGQERQLALMVNLAPGDFRTVRQAFSYLGGRVSHAQLLDALEQESVAKRRAGIGGSGIGFVAKV